MRGSFLALFPDQAHPAALGDAAATLLASAWRQDPGTPWFWTSPTCSGMLTSSSLSTVFVAGRAWLRNGEIVQRNDLDRMVCLSEPGKIVAELCREIWGAYVAFVRSAEDGSWWVLRTPSGAQQAATWRSAGVEVVASGVADLPARLRPQPGVSVDRVADQMRRPDIAQAWSPLLAVRSLAPGETVQLGRDGGRSSMAWTPAAIVRAGYDGARRTAEDKLRAAVAVSCAAESEGRDVFLELSGGLDSAIVASVLVAAGRASSIKVAANFFADRPDGDERLWAEQVADHLSLPFATKFKPLEPFGEADFDELADEVHPAIDTLDAARDHAVSDWLVEVGANAVVTGQGGDAVFFQAASAGMLLEALRRGPRRDVSRLIFDLAKRQRTSIWPILSDAIFPRKAGFATYLTAEAKVDAQSPTHPWLADVQGLGPAQAMQVRSLISMLAKFGPSRRRERAEVLHPLLAQPVTEACLAVPSWWHVTGGRDRALARDAFASALPKGFMTRTSKGAMSSFYARRMAMSLDVFRPYLLDGWLAQQGLLDRAAVAAVLDPDDLVWRARGLALLRIAALEAWVRRWA